MMPIVPYDRWLGLDQGLVLKYIHCKRLHACEKRSNYNVMRIQEGIEGDGEANVDRCLASTARAWSDHMLWLTTRTSRRSAAPGQQYMRLAIRIDNFSRNSKVLSPDASYCSKLNGRNSHNKVGTGVPAAAAAAAMAFARSLRFTTQQI
jgi:hypothetical protein